MQKKKLLQNNVQARKLTSKTDIMPSERPALSEQEHEQINLNLLGAAINGDNDKIRRLIEAGADITAKDEGLGRAPLHFAALYGHPRACILLITEYAKSGGNMKKFINVKSGSSKTAMEYAADRGDAKIAQLLKSIELLADMVIKETFNSFLASFGDCLAS